MRDENSYEEGYMKGLDDGYKEAVNDFLKKIGEINV
jgi:flagellar biosynthesis/type III secretory pathway protein FliH